MIKHIIMNSLQCNWLQRPKNGQKLNGNCVLISCCIECRYILQKLYLRALYRQHLKLIGLTGEPEDEPGSALFYNLITARVNIVVLYEWDARLWRTICPLQPKLIVSQFTSLPRSPAMGKMRGTTCLTAKPSKMNVLMSCFKYRNEALICESSRQQAARTR